MFGWLGWVGILKCLLWVMVASTGLYSFYELSHSFFPPVPQGKSPEWVLENGGGWRLICIIGAWYLNWDLSTPKHELFLHQDDGGSHWLRSLSQWSTQCQADKTWSWATALASHFREEAPKLKLFPPASWYTKSILSSFLKETLELRVEQRDDYWNWIFGGISSISCNWIWSCVNQDAFLSFSSFNRETGICTIACTFTTRMILSQGLN